MKEEEAFEIRFAHKEDWEDAMGLAWKTFLEFEAGDYAPEGIRSFEDFISDTGLKRMFLSGDYQMMVAWSKGIKAGANLGTRDTYAHIAATVADYLGVNGNFSGSSFLPDILG